MSNDLKREYIRILWFRYQNANKKKKTLILNEFCAVSGLTRKHAIKLLNRVPEHWFKKRPGRKRVYSDQAIYHLRKLWLFSKQLNSKRLRDAIPDWLEQYTASESVKRELKQMSSATIERYLAPFRVKVTRRRRSGTRNGRLLKTVIPIKPFDFKIHQPGHVEADTVAHCGGSLSGEFIWSLTFTDIFSGWTENRAIWGKGAGGVLDAIRDIEGKLPFPILSFNSDNGSEFLNNHLIRYLGPEGEKKRPTQLMTRSREYRKNDNCHVEQKNWTHVRELFGYDRFSNPEQVKLMNHIYTAEHNLLHNFFYPQMKLKSKVRVGSKYRRTYDRPQTPYRRILACEQVSEEVKDSLTVIFKSLNPFRLTKDMDKKLKAFYQANHPITEEKEVA
jgi:hypothetical protein